MEIRGPQQSVEVRFFRGNVTLSFNIAKLCELMWRQDGLEYVQRMQLCEQQLATPLSPPMPRKPWNAASTGGKQDKNN